MLKDEIIDAIEKRSQELTREYEALERYSKMAFERLKIVARMEELEVMREWILSRGKL